MRAPYGVAGFQRRPRVTLNPVHTLPVVARGAGRWALVVLGLGLHAGGAMNVVAP